MPGAGCAYSLGATCPELTFFQVHIVLPPLQDIRPVVERLRALGDVVAVRANRSGKLQISAATENAKIDVVWGNLQNPRIGEYRSAS